MQTAAITVLNQPRGGKVGCPGCRASRFGLCEVIVARLVPISFRGLGRAVSLRLPGRAKGVSGYDGSYGPQDSYWL